MDIIGNLNVIAVHATALIALTLPIAIPLIALLRVASNYAQRIEGK